MAEKFTKRVYVPKTGKPEIVEVDIRSIATKISNILVYDAGTVYNLMHSIATSIDDMLLDELFPPTEKEKRQLLRLKTQLLRLSLLGKKIDEIFDKRVDDLVDERSKK